MFSTEFNSSTKLKTTKILHVVIATLVLIACTNAQAGETRTVVKTDQGPFIGVNKNALDDLQAYKSASTPSAATYHHGRRATDDEIAAWDIDISPDGHGLPQGSGNVAAGAALYASKCAACHGANGEGTPYDALVAKESTGKTIGSFWPYASTVFDYIRRGMPFDNPGSLSNEEVYSVTAFLLYKNDLILEDTIIDAESLPKVAMPNLESFTPDEREDHNFPY